MARTRTLAELRAEVRQRADIENDPHVTDAEVDRFINQSAAFLHQEAALACEDEYTTSATIPTVAGTEGYGIGVSTFFKLVSIDALVNGISVPLRKWSFAERHRYLNASTWGLAGQPLAYRLVNGDTIRFLPVPDAVYQVTVWYIPCVAALVADADKYDGRDGFEEWIVLDSAIKAKTKGEEDLRPLQAERAEVWARVVRSLGTKDQAEPDKISETVRTGGFDRYGLDPYWRR